MTNATDVLTGGEASVLPGPSSVELVIFDCDGVPVDSKRIANEVLAEILGRELINPLPPHRGYGRSVVRSGDAG